MSSRRVTSGSNGQAQPTSRRVSGTQSLDEALPQGTTRGNFNQAGFGSNFRGRRPNGRFLYLLPLLMLPGFLRTFASGNFGESLAIVIGALLLFAGGWFVKRGIAQEARMDANQVVLPSRIPNKNLGAALYGLGIFLASAFVARYGIAMGLLYGLVTAAAVIVRYGPDRKLEKSEVLRKAELSGIDVGALLKSLEEAKGRVATIRTNGARLKDQDFRAQIQRIAGEADAVIGQIERDPKDVRSSRKFLISYLKRAEEVTQRYADKQASYAAKENGDEITKKFAEALNDLETVFQEQNAKLLANDSLDLEVKLDVLSQRLKLEGAG